MNSYKKVSSSLACFALSAGMMTHTPQARAIDPVSGVGMAFLAHSLFSYYSAFPEDQAARPNGYNVAEFKQALKDLAHGIDTKKNLAIVRKNLYWLYYDGLIGHTSAFGSPRKDEKKGITECAYIESRGVYGWIGEKATSLAKTANFAKEALAFTALIIAGTDYFKNGGGLTRKLAEVIYNYFFGDGSLSAGVSSGGKLAIESGSAKLTASAADFKGGK
jgi:hypothetical protein